MSRFALIVTLLFVSLLPLRGRAEDSAPTDSILLADTVATVVTAAQKPAPFDTTRDSGYWWRALKHLKLDVWDTTIVYPRAIDFGLKVYRWADHTFNSYDSAYVVNASPKKWKIMLVNNNFYDGYQGHLTTDRLAFQANSDFRSNFGFKLAYMAVSAGYSFNLNSWLNGRKLSTTRYDFSFNCSRVGFDAYYMKDDAETNLHRLGHYRSKHLLNAYKFTGISRELYGFYAYYFFNHLRYAQPAAYGFSKLQKRSAGSFVVGIHATHQDIVFDFTKLDDAPDEISSQVSTVLPDTARVFRFRHREYSLQVGYGYNWVFHSHWLFNVTAMPGVGYLHTFPNSVDGKRDTVGLNYRIKAALVRYAGNWFYGLHFFITGHWYLSHNHSLYNDFGDLNATVGFRF